ncbi:MAG: hypothetical protein BGO41_10625 [Clostridiales bacterium 38-18]|nr:MAG: hypothetical protein BGO41_10625 [Clostridiales bacterium 38-18]
MISIYLCEDQDLQLEQISQIIENHILIENLDMSIALKAKSPTQLLSAIEGNKTSNIYFLDVDLRSSMNGIELAEAIRKSDPRGFIIFVTTHSEMSHLTFKYKVEALDFIIKGDLSTLKRQVISCLDNITQKLALASPELQKRFNLRTKDKTVNVAYDDIYFFETAYAAHKIVMHCKSQIIEFNGNLSDIVDQLDDYFVRCHRSFIVNLTYVNQIDHTKKMLHLKNGQTCIASTKGLRLLKQRLNEIFPDR